MEDFAENSIDQPSNLPTLEGPCQTPPRTAYLDAFKKYDGAKLADIALRLGKIETPAGRSSLAMTIAESFDESRTADRIYQSLPQSARLALSLFAITERLNWPAHAARHAITCLGVDPNEALGTLLERGILAASASDGSLIREFVRVIELPTGPTYELHAHPAVLSTARTVLPEGSPLPRAESVRQIRESDGLEPILRMAAIWQRVVEAPLRQTQQGTLYKRDRDRIEDDSVIAGPIADAMEPLPDQAAFWLSLARGVGLIAAEPGTERISAATADFWSENAYHLAQMASARWLGLRNWHELGGIQREGAVHELSLPYLRPVVMLWLATLGDDEWIAIENLGTHLRALAPNWDQATFIGLPVAEPSAATRGRAPKAKAKEASSPDTAESASLTAMLLGPGYQLGLIRVAVEGLSDRKAVQLTPLGRYLLALGPPPASRPAFEHFLFVQPSFEIIAYRQGLTASLIGQFSQFAHWDQIGAALGLRLTPESVYRGLEGGMSPELMMNLLSRHSSRPLPAGVAEAVRTWANRRERVTYYGSTTLVEFATPLDLERALQVWPSTREGTSAPVKVSDRLLLVESDAAIPFQRFRMTGARDYRRPAEACVEVEADGVTLTLDLARSDLLVDAELARFADEEDSPSLSDRTPHENPRRRFTISAASLERAAEAGFTTTQLSQWFQRRTGQDIPPAARLLWTIRSARLAPLITARPLVLHTPNAELLDGLTQHPDTRKLLGDRLGPTSVVIPDDTLPEFRRALEILGLSLGDPGSSTRLKKS